MSTTAQIEPQVDVLLNGFKSALLLSPTVS